MDDEVDRETMRTLRMMFTSGSQLIEVLARSRQRRLENKLRDEEQRRRQQAETERTQDQQWRDARRAAYEPTAWSDWQDTASLNDWATAYSAARELRDGHHDAHAARAADFIREAVHDRYGVDIAAAYDEQKRRAEMPDTGRRERAAAARDEAVADEGVDRERAADDRERAADHDGPLHGTTMTDEEFHQRHRHMYQDVGQPNWASDRSAEDVLRAYAVARESEAVDPTLAPMAARKLEQDIAAMFPHEFASAQDVRHRWDDLLDRADPGRAHRPDAHREASADRLRDRAAHRDSDAAEHAETAAEAQQVVVAQDRARRTTLDHPVSEADRHAAETIVRDAAPGHAAIDKGPTRREITSSKAKSRAPQQQRGRSKGRGR